MGILVLTLFQTYSGYFIYDILSLIPSLPPLHQFYRVVGIFWSTGEVATLFHALAISIYPGFDVLPNHPICF